MPPKATLYPIYGIEDDPRAVSPYGPPALPVKILTDVGIEDVRALLDAETFEGIAEHFGKYALADVKAVRYALVHRYSSDATGQDAALNQQSERLIRNLAACLRLIRPMRQRAGLMRGELRNGALRTEFIEHQAPMEVPELHRLFSVRDGDIDLFRAVAGHFLAAMAGPFWKFRMAIEFHETGYFLPLWKARYILWCSAIESLYTSENFQHRGSLVATERIKWFLGANTSIYSPGDIPRFMQQANVSVGTIVGDL